MLLESDGGASGGETDGEADGGAPGGERGCGEADDDGAPRRGRGGGGGRVALRGLRVAEPARDGLGLAAHMVVTRRTNVAMFFSRASTARNYGACGIKGSKWDHDKLLASS